ncbi:hypothetical protein, partial [Hoeflea sp.]|uniref:hypothetical protein n=1 Tax=Hoeflea sp. TaxID=1940281 RepID=UPI003A8C8ADC
EIVIVLAPLKKHGPKRSYTEDRTLSVPTMVTNLDHVGILGKLHDRLLRHYLRGGNRHQRGQTD